MPKIARELSALEVKRLVTPGVHSVGGVTGLYLQVRSATARSWILNVVVGDRRRIFGLGSFPTVLLEAARDKARQYRDAIERGLDPAAERRKVKAALLAARLKSVTFRDAAKSVLAIKRKEFRNGKHADQWEATLTTYADPIIGDLTVSDIETGHVLKILEPIWTTKTETATRLRQRIEKILDWCTARGYRTGENPARWAGHLKELLPQPEKIRSRRHFPALHYNDLPACIARLTRVPGTAARALEFTILTAARSGEVRGATWDEVDIAGQVWTVPAERMKSGRLHRVPLSHAASDLLMRLPRVGPLVFPSPRNSDKLSDTALLMVLRRMQVDAVPHGFRATFKTWSSEQTHYPRDVIEAALAHTLESKVEAAYQRGDLLDKRRGLLNEWAAFCQSSAGGSEHGQDHQ